MCIRGGSGMYIPEYRSGSSPEMVSPATAPVPWKHLVRMYTLWISKSLAYSSITIELYLRICHSLERQSMTNAANTERESLMSTIHDYLKEYYFIVLL